MGCAVKYGEFGVSFGVEKFTNMVFAVLLFLWKLGRALNLDCSDDLSSHEVELCPGLALGVISVLSDPLWCPDRFPRERENKSRGLQNASTPRPYLRCKYYTLFSALTPSGHIIYGELCHGVPVL